MTHAQREYRSQKRIHQDILNLVSCFSLIKKNMKILDVACGTGVLTEKLLSIYPYLSHHVYMIDIEELTVPLDGAYFIRGNLNSTIELEDNLFDLIISTETIEHLYNPHGFLKELSRVLKQGGRLIITTPNIHNIFSRALFLFTGDLQWFRRWSMYQPGGHIWPLYEMTLELLLKKNKFKIIKKVTTTGRILGTKITFPVRGQFWGEILIYFAEK